MTHFLGLQQDVTESKQSKQRLSVLNRILRHNLRNKINVIQAYADQIEDEDKSTADALDSIRTAADLLTVGDRVREFDSVISASHDEMEPIDLAVLVEENVTSLEADATDAEITVTTPESATIAGHPSLRAALGDLFAQLGEPTEPSATVEITREDDVVVLQVTDQGGALSGPDLEIIGHDIETPTEHLQGVELWLLRWAVERSRGEMHATTGEFPTIELRFPPVDDTA